MPRRGQIRKRSNGKYLSRVFVGKDDSGKRHWVSKTFDKKKDAEGWLSQQLADKAKGSFLVPSRESTGAYLSRWLTDIAAKRVAERTLDDYGQAVEKYLIPHLGYVLLSELRPDQIQSAYNKMETNNGPHITRKCHAVLHSALSQAVKWGLISRNPASLVQPPKIPQAQVRPISENEVSSFLVAIEGNRYEAYFFTLLDTGMRPGEALALTWDDIDLERGIIHISKAISTGAKKFYIGPGKTSKARRSISIAPETANKLKQHREQIASERAKKEGWSENNLVFPNTVGNYSDESNIMLRYFKPALKQAGLPSKIRIYDLRHSMATLLLEANTNPKIVAERMGHADVTMALNRYSHVTPTMQQQAAETMAGLLVISKSVQSTNASNKQQSL